MKWFGKAYGAPYEADTPHVSTPVGAQCAHCGEPIGFHDDGLLIPHLGAGPITHRCYHYECHGCTCCGGTEEPDPPNVTRREAARQAVKNWNQNR